VAVRRWHRSWFRSRWTELAGRRREIARFFVLSDLTALCNTAIKNVDVLILGAFRPVSEVGFYNLGKSLTTQLLVVVSAVRAVAFPRIMRMWTTGDWESLWSTVRSHTWRLAAPGTVAVGALMLAVVPAIELVYGSDYTPAAPVARLLLLQVVLLLLTLWVDMVFLAWGHLRVLLLARALGAVIVTVGTVLLAPRWGGAAAASMLLLQQAVSAVITFTWMYRHRGTHRAEAQRRASVHAGGRS
jgi:O-antigen/teichoic acid export membrane protein